MNKTISRILGTISLAVMGILMYFEYAVIVGIKALSGIVVDILGIEGSAAIGITILSYVPVIGLIIFLLLLIVVSGIIGIILVTTKL